jgi:hypothetical protein
MHLPRVAFAVDASAHIQDDDCFCRLLISGSHMWSMF